MQSGVRFGSLTFAVNQVELHPYCQQNELIKFCNRHGIQVEGYSPLGTGDFKQPDEPVVLHDETVLLYGRQHPLFTILQLSKIAKAHNKSVAQVCIRWGVQRGTVVLPKSVNPSRIKENINVYDFELTEGNMV